MTVESRRGGAPVAPDSVSAAAAAQARSAETQRQLGLTAAERKHFELVCEVMPDWNNNEIVAFLQKCNYSVSVINDALMNAFEDLRPSADQSAADWNVKSKKSKRRPKEKAPAATTTPGEPSVDRRRSGPRDRPERDDRPDRRDRKDRPAFDRRPRRDTPKTEGTVPKPMASSGVWGEAQSTLPSDAGAWAEPPTATTADVTESSPSPVPDAAEGTASAPRAEAKRTPPATAAGTISWAGITKRGLTKPSAVAAKPEAPESAVEPEAPESAEPEPVPAPADEAVGQWGPPEPALAVDAAEPVPAPVAAEPEPEPVPALAEPEVPTLPPPANDAETPAVALPSTDDLLAASEPVILPEFVSQQAAALHSTMIQFGSFTVADAAADLASSNAECVRLHAAQADFTQQQQLHDIDDVAGDMRARPDYDTAMPVHGFYPPAFLSSMPSYMPYDADTTYFEPYGQQPQQQQQQQRVQRPRQQPYRDARNNKARRDHRNAANVPRQDEFPPQAMPDQAAGAFAQGVPDRDVKQAGVERGGPRGNKQRQSERGRGGLSGSYHHPSYGGAHIPVGYGQPYAYPAPYMPQFYGQSQQGYGPPGFRHPYSQYQGAGAYQPPYQPRSAYLGQNEYVEAGGMHHLGQHPHQHQGEPGPASKQQAESETPNPAVLYPFEQAAWPEQHRYMLQQQQAPPSSDASAPPEPTAAEGAPVPHSSFDRRPDGSSPAQPPISFGYGGQQPQPYSGAHTYQNFSTQPLHQYDDSANRSYPHWASHQ